MNKRKKGNDEEGSDDEIDPADDGVEPVEDDFENEAELQGEGEAVEESEPTTVTVMEAEESFEHEEDQESGEGGQHDGVNTRGLDAMEARIDGDFDRVPQHVQHAHSEDDAGDQRQRELKSPVGQLHHGGYEPSEDGHQENGDAVDDQSRGGRHDGGRVSPRSKERPVMPSNGTGIQLQGPQ